MELEHLFFRLIRSVMRASKFKLIEIVICVGCIHLPFLLPLFVCLRIFRLGFSTQNPHIVHIVNYITFEKVYLSFIVEVSFM